MSAINSQHLLSYKLIVRYLLLTATVSLTACGGHDHISSENGHGDHAAGHADDSEGHHDSAAGVAGDASKVNRTIAVDMSDAMQFTPASIDVKAGETIRFEVTNSGKILHEFVIGSNEEILEHHELMKKFPGMEHEDEPNSVSLQTNEAGEVIWQFTTAGSYDFACLQPGHYEAGMKGKFMVSDK